MSAGGRANLDVERAADWGRGDAAGHDELALHKVEVDEGARVAAPRQVVGEQPRERRLARVRRPGDQHARALAAAALGEVAHALQLALQLQVAGHRRLGGNVAVTRAALHLECAALPREDRLLRA